MTKDVAAVVVEAVSGSHVVTFFGMMRAVRLAERQGLVYCDQGHLRLADRLAFSLCLPASEPPTQTPAPTTPSQPPRCH